MDAAWPRSPSYVIWSVINWLIFLGGVFFLAWASSLARLPLPVLWGLVVVLAGTVAVQFAAAYRLIAAQDEFVRGITAKRVIAAAGVTLTVAVLWGLGQQFLRLPPMPMWLLYPFFWGAFGIVTPFIRSSRP